MYKYNKMYCKRKKFALIHNDIAPDIIEINLFYSSSLSKLLHAIKIMLYMHYYTMFITTSAYSA